MVPGSRNPMWGEEFNFSVDELPVQVDGLSSLFCYGVVTTNCLQLLKMVSVVCEVQFWPMVMFKLFWPIKFQDFFYNCKAYLLRTYLVFLTLLPWFMFFRRPNNVTYLFTIHFILIYFWQSIMQFFFISHLLKQVWCMCYFIVINNLLRIGPNNVMISLSTAYHLNSSFAFS